MKLYVLAILIVLFAIPASSQDRGGDKPVRNNGKVRETRFKSRNKQGDRPRTRDVAGRRVRTKNKSSVNRASYPLPKMARAARNRRQDDRAGRPVSPIYSSRPRDTQRPWKDGIYGRRIHVRSATGKARNVYSNQSQLALLRSIQKPPGDQGRGKKKVIPRSASRAYLRHSSINPIARFSRKHKRGDQAILTDPAGRRPRGKNFETPRPPVVNATDPYRGRKRVGDRPYRSPGGGGIVSSAIKTPRAWKGDITGRRIRGQNYQTKVRTGGQIPGRLQASDPRFGDRRLHGKRKGVGYKTATISGEKRPGRALPGKMPGIGAKGITGLTVRTRSQNPLTPGRAGKSRSGKLWNNSGNPLPVRQPASGSLGAGTFQGNLKLREPLKPRMAGKSKSGQLWNNRESPLPRRPPTSIDQRAAAFQGNMKLKRPLTPKEAGKSKSGELWNNNGMPLDGTAPPRAIRTQALFQGNIKGGRPMTPRNAGKSKSGVLWNNNETAIKSKPPSDITVAANRYKGDVRLSRLKSAYVKNPNASALALKKSRPEKNTFDVDEIRSRTRAFHYVKNPSSASGALKVREPGKAFVRATDYQGNIRMKKFDLFGRRDLHPDSQFVKTNKNNVKGEKDALTGFRLWWSRTFRKNDEQPEHLKDKPGKPRYDKGEEGLWYD